MTAISPSETRRPDQQIGKDNIRADLAAFYNQIPASDIDYAVHISLQHKYIFTIVPKAACSMLRLGLNRFEFDDQPRIPWAMDVIHSREFTPTLRPSQVGNFRALARRPDYFKFCFVRDPYTRLLSAYLNRIAGNKEQKQQVLKKLRRGWMPRRSEITFSEFVRFVADQSVAEMDPHWRTQYHQTMQGAIHYDFTGRVERFDDDIKTVAARLGERFMACMPRAPLNVHNAAAQLGQYYTPELLDLATRIYSIDLETFGYARLRIDDLR